VIGAEFINAVKTNFGFFLKVLMIEILDLKKFRLINAGAIVFYACCLKMK